MRFRLFHATNINNRSSIKKNGLKPNRDNSSGYGKNPTHNAVYLYHLNNVDVPCDLMQVFGGAVDIWEVTNLDESKLIADEDSGKDTWIESIEKMGTCAYNGIISPSNLKYCGSFKTETEYESWVAIEKLNK